MGAPIKLTYSREDELQHDLYRPASAVRFMATRDSTGWPTAWFARIACPTWMALRNGVARESVEGIADYDIPNVKVEYHDPRLPIPTGYWRSVGLSQNTFFAESFLDEMAVAGRKDPVEIRRRMYAKSPRLLGVLNLAAEKAKWGTPLPAGRFRGIAAVAGFGSFNAQVAEVSIAQGKVRVHRVVCAVDCGRVINPIGVVQQAEGAMVYGLSAALRGNITIDRGRVAETNFHQYEPLRMNEMPEVEVHIVPSTAAPGGNGRGHDAGDRASGGQCDLRGDRKADSAVAVQPGEVRLTIVAFPALAREPRRSSWLKGSPLLDLDPPHDAGAAFAVGTEHKRLPLNGGGRLIWKCCRDVRHMRNKHAVRALRKLLHLLLQPLRLSGCDGALHRLRTFTQFGGWARIRQPRQPRCLTRAIGRARQHLADRDLQTPQRLTHRGRGGAALLVELTFGRNVVGIRVVRNVTAASSRGA